MPTRAPSAAKRIATERPVPPRLAPVTSATNPSQLRPTPALYGSFRATGKGHDGQADRRQAWNTVPVSSNCWISSVASPSQSRSTSAVSAPSRRPTWPTRPGVIARR